MIPIVCKRLLHRDAQELAIGYTSRSALPAEWTALVGQSQLVNVGLKPVST